MDSLFSASYRVRHTLAAIAAALLAGTATAGVTGLQPVPPARVGSPVSEQIESLYIVQLDAAPALAIAANERDAAKRAGLLSAAALSNRLDMRDRKVRQRAEDLESAQDQLLRALGLSGKRVYSYRYTFNGVAVKLTQREAERLSLRKGVTKVWQDRRKRVSTNFSSAFLGLTDAGTGLRTGLGLQGKDVIIGVIDSGITPNHPSFGERGPERDKPRLCRSDWAQNNLLGLWLCRKYTRPGPVLFTSAPENWQGVCEAGENFAATSCNNKLIGARYFNAGFLAEGPADINEFTSPADADGHGTHIASIAAGNFVDAQIFGRQIGRISGIAPLARVAVYKACWLEPGGFRATCSVADLQAAIEAAVEDGVDIINYSVGSLDDSLTDPDDLALLAAADAGVLSVAASGNDGPENFTMLAPATTPWVISVGASTRSGTRVAEGSRVNKPASVAKDYETREGSFTPRLSERGPLTGDLVLTDDGEVLTPDGEIGTVFDGCSPLVNSSDISGKIAYIQRGGCDFDVKVSNAQNAGAIAVVVYSNDDNLQTMAGNSAGITIPAVLIGQADGQLLRDKIAGDEIVEITLDKSIFVDLTQTGNVMGSFSGRGPSLADSDFLKPDVVAPGVQILGGHTPDVANGFRGEFFQYLSGTSQSTPQVAGVAALIREANPDWTPGEIKSALMTTARQDILKDIGGAAADPFDFGAGHIVPNLSVDPGLLYPVSTEEYDSYLCTAGLPRLSETECAALVASGLNLDARDVNLPSVAITELVNTVEVTRRVRNTGAAATYTASVDTPTGVDLEISPQTLTLDADEEAEFLLRFTNAGAPLGEWQYGSFAWTSDTHRVRSPFSVMPMMITFTDLISTTGAAGNAVIDVEFGYNGAYTASVTGLELPCVLPDNNLNDSICTNTGSARVDNDPFNNYEFLGTEPFGVTRFFVTLTSDEDLLFRVSLFDALTDGNDDLDLYVYYCVDGTLCTTVDDVGASQRAGTSDENVDVEDPPAGTYIIDVHGYETDATIGDSGAQFCVYTWGLGTAGAAGNLTLTGDPGAANSGTQAALNLSWSGLGDGLWLGGVAHDQSPISRLGLSVLEVDVNGLPVQDPAAFTCP